MTAKGIDRLRLKLLAWGVGAIAVGVGLILLSRFVLRTSEEGQNPPTASAPATAPAAATQPATQPATPTRTARQVAAQNLSNMLLLCSLLSFAVAGVAFVWLGWEVRRAAVPAWKRNPKKRW